MQNVAYIQLFEKMPLALQQQVLAFMQFLLQQHELLANLKPEPKTDWQTAEKFYSSIRINMNHFKFNREDANER